MLRHVRVCMRMVSLQAALYLQIVARLCAHTVRPREAGRLVVPLCATVRRHLSDICCFAVRPHGPFRIRSRREISANALRTPRTRSNFWTAFVDCCHHIRTSLNSFFAHPRSWHRTLLLHLSFSALHLTTLHSAHPALF